MYTIGPINYGPPEDYVRAAPLKIILPVSTSRLYDFNFLLLRRADRKNNSWRRAVESLSFHVVPKPSANLSILASDGRSKRANNKEVVGILLSLLALLT